MHGLKVKSRRLHFGDINRSNGSRGIYVKDQKGKIKGAIQGVPICMG